MNGIIAFSCKINLPSGKKKTVFMCTLLSKLETEISLIVNYSNVVFNISFYYNLNVIYLSAMPDYIL